MSNNIVKKQKTKKNKKQIQVEMKEVEEEKSKDKRWIRKPLIEREERWNVSQMIVWQACFVLRRVGVHFNDSCYANPVMPSEANMPSRQMIHLHFIKMYNLLFFGVNFREFTIIHFFMRIALPFYEFAETIKSNGRNLNLILPRNLITRGYKCSKIILRNRLIPSSAATNTLYMRLWRW